MGGDDVSANLAHDDAVADDLGFAGENDDVAGEGGDDFLPGEGEAGAEHGDAGGEAAGVVEPDGAEADGGDGEEQDTDALAGAEGGLPLVASQNAGDGAQQLIEQPGGGERRRQEELAAVLA